MVEWESDHLIVLRDGRTVHTLSHSFGGVGMGKGVTETRSPQRKHIPDMKDWTNYMPTSLWGIANRAEKDGSLFSCPFDASAKRVYPRSPVREYRTPGSVRGHPGNRVSYLDTSGPVD